MASKGTRRIAILIDADQVAYACWHHLEDTAARMGRIVARKAVSADPGTRWSRHREVDVVTLDGKVSSRRCNGATLALAFEAGRMIADRRADDFVLASGDAGLAGLADMISRSGARVHAAVPLNAANAVPALVRASDTCFMLTPRDRVMHAERRASRTAINDSVMRALGSLEFLKGLDEEESGVDVLERGLSEPDKPRTVIDGDGRITEEGESLIRKAIGESSARPEGWVRLGRLGIALRQLGCPPARGRLRDALAAHPAFELDGQPGLNARARIAPGESPQS